MTTAHQSRGETVPDSVSILRFSGVLEHASVQPSPLPSVPDSASSPSAASSLRPAAIGGLQGAVWVVYGVAYYLTLRPHQPFADLLWKQTLIAAGSGLLLSTGLGALYWTLGLRRRQPLWEGLTIFVGGVAVGLLWS